MNKSLLKLIQASALFLFCQHSMAAVLDFTDNSLISSLTSVSNGYSGTIDGVGFTLTSNIGTLNFNQNYDGNLQTGCNGTPLSCNKDGAGISNDELDAQEILTLTFDSVVEISELYFLDLYNGQSQEQAEISFDGVFFANVDGTETAGQGGYAELVFSPIFALILQFTAPINSLHSDDSNNDYALAGVNVSAIPIPPAIWLLGTALAGLFRIRRAASK